MAQRKNPQIRKTWDLSYKGSPGETSNRESLTIQDDHIDIRQMQKNYSNGLPLGVSAKNGVYTGDMIPPSGDLLEQKAARDHLQKLEDTLQKQKKQKDQEERKQKLQDEIQKRVDEALAEQAPKPPGESTKTNTTQ